MSFNELNSVEQTIIQKLSGVNLNAAAPSPLVVKEDPTPHGSFRCQHRSAEALKRPSKQVLSARNLLEGELRETSIHLNPRIRPAQDQAVIAIDAFIAFTGLQSTPKPDRLEA